MKRFLLIIILFIAASLSNEAFSGTKNEILNVGATVIPVVEYEFLHQENSLVITSADIERGFIDINNGIIVAVKTNSLNGYMLNIAFDSSLFKEIIISDENISSPVKEGFGELHMPFQGKNYLTKELTIRFYFSANTEPGTYKWPVSLAAFAI